MKKIFLFLSIILNITVNSTANPFSLKSEYKIKNPIVRPTYKGYIHHNKIWYAIVLFKEEEYSIKIGESIKGWKLLKITPETLTFKHRKEIIKIIKKTYSME